MKINTNGAASTPRDNICEVTAVFSIQECTKITFDMRASMNLYTAAPLASGRMVPAANSGDC